MSDTAQSIETLSKREAEVAAAYADGASYKVIARDLGISPTTVRSHLRTVYGKLNVTSKAKEGDDVLFVLEIDYVGLFHIANVPEEQLHPFLLIECPRMIFPFLRRVVSDVTRDGGFPPLNLENIDFLSMYRAELARRQQQEQPTAQA